MAVSQSIKVTIPVCSKCKREIVCEACGKSTATEFGILTITDDLVAMPRDMCNRCNRVWAIRPEDRIRSDARAVEWAESSTRNMHRYFNMREKGQSVSERKDGQVGRGGCLPDAPNSD